MSQKRGGSGALPDTGWLRERQILGDPKADPPIPALIPVGRSTWWRGIKDGRFPQPTKIGPNMTAWRVEDIKKLIESLGDADYPVQPSVTKEYWRKK